jgi:hypothetical protein
MFPRKHTISGKELINKWNTGIHELSYLILKHDITVLDPSNLPKIKFSFNPDDYKIDSEKVLDIILNDPNSLSAMLFWLPDLTRLAIAKDISSLKSKATSKPSSLAEEISSHKQKSPSKPHSSNPDTGVRYCRKSRKGYSPFSRTEPEKHVKDTTKSEKTIKNIIEDQEEKIQQHSNVFSLIGKVWFVKFNQQEWGLYPDQKKYKYLAYLLNLSANIGTNDLREVSIENYALTDCVNPKSDLPKKNNYCEENSDELVSAEYLSKEEIWLVKDNLKNLLDKIAVAKDYDDENMIKHAEEEFYEYVRHLKSQGVIPVIKDDGNKIYLKCHKRLNAEGEKIRQTVKNNIRNAIKDFKDKMPSLVEHLENFCKTKLTETIYHPIPPTSWFVSF